MDGSKGKDLATPAGGGRGCGRGLRITALVLATILSVPAAPAATREARIAVGATVLARAAVVAEQSPFFLEVTGADLARSHEPSSPRSRSARYAGMSLRSGD